MCFHGICISVNFMFVLLVCCWFCCFCVSAFACVCAQVHSCLYYCFCGCLSWLLLVCDWCACACACACAVFVCFCCVHACCLCLLMCLSCVCQCMFGWLFARLFVWLVGSTPCSPGTTTRSRRSKQSHTSWRRWTPCRKDRLSLSGSDKWTPFVKNMAMVRKLFPKVANMPNSNHRNASVFFQDQEFMRSYQIQLVVCLFMLIENGFVLQFGSLPSHVRDNTNTKQSSARRNKTTSVHIQAVETS